MSGPRYLGGVALLATLLLTLIVTPSPALCAAEGGGEGSSGVLTVAPLTLPSPRESAGRGSLSVNVVLVDTGGVSTFASLLFEIARR